MVCCIFCINPQLSPQASLPTKPSPFAPSPLSLGLSNLSRPPSLAPFLRSSGRQGVPQPPFPRRSVGGGGLTLPHLCPHPHNGAKGGTFVLTRCARDGASSFPPSRVPSSLTEVSRWTLGWGHHALQAGPGPSTLTPTPTQPGLLGPKLGKPGLFCPGVKQGQGSYIRALFQISKKIKTGKGPHGLELVAYIFLIERSQLPKYCFHRLIDIEYSCHSHFQNYFWPVEQRGAPPP